MLAVALVALKTSGLDHLRLEVVGCRALRTTTSICVLKELPSVEETLGKLAGALGAACKAAKSCPVSAITVTQQ